MALDSRPTGAPATPGGRPVPYATEPDYTRPAVRLTDDQRRRFARLLGVMYGEDAVDGILPELERLLRVHEAHKSDDLRRREAAFRPEDRFSERDVVLITYGDLLTSPGHPPLQVLARFLRRFMRGAMNTVHILPFFPYSSDRGFAIIDYEEVDPRLGTWDDIAALAGEFRLMFDGVFNHASSRSRWFQHFRDRRPGYEDFFVAFTTRDAIAPDYLRLILRPRTSDLLTPFATLDGTRYVWTTFSPDQVDLNFRNPRVLLRVVEILLAYVRRGADLVRLDAVTYIWRELGTSCAHLRETHAVVQLFRAVLDAAAPAVALITETNVPHVDNVSYFGDGSDEAQLVYNFALPPLVLHTFHTGSCDALARWARTLAPPSPTTTFFNFLSSHDGVGLLGARGILTDEQIGDLVARTRAHGGYVSYRSNGDGTESPYELNITWYSALNRDDAGEPQALQVARFVAARALALVLQGVPGIYLPTLFGATNDTETVRRGAEKRSINRRTYDEATLVRALEDRASRESQVGRRMRRLVRRRVAQPAFHPAASQAVLDLGPHVFGVLRERPGVQRLLALVNVTAESQVADVPSAVTGPAEMWVDVLSRRTHRPEGDRLTVHLPPYGVAWLTAVV
ncbi:sucrose phosphorylase [Luteitalea sp. TBR-22]|uniref:alpha-amylase family glycosyl hydrolase n=1 Tax=Luteitalea sp. TBR-22 TaxID=2802971 RepID=UPI001AF1A33B|nr:alpha-amylase family glycosyl hydrolase [Luteitalea sp. TBR-22]BCS32837.1 sucrose phosphorylase [Luteitalea sp. TBR-22]